MYYKSKCIALNSCHLYFWLWFIHLICFLCPTQEYFTNTKIASITVGGKQGRAWGKHRTISMFLADLHTNIQRGSQHVLDLNSQPPDRWETSGPLRCSSALTEWTTEASFRLWRAHQIHQQRLAIRFTFKTESTYVYIQLTVLMYKCKRLQLCVWASMRPMAHRSPPHVQGRISNSSQHQHTWALTHRTSKQITRQAKLKLPSWARSHLNSPK